MDDIYINNSCSSNLIITVNDSISKIYDDYIDNYDEIKNTVIITPIMYIITFDEYDIILPRYITILEENNSDIFFSCFEDSKNINQVKAIINDNTPIALSTYVFDSMTEEVLQEEVIQSPKSYGIYAFSLFMFGIGTICVNKVLNNN